MSALTVVPDSRFGMPALIARAGKPAARSFLELFIFHIRNENTRRAYGRAAAAFLHWCKGRRIDRLQDVQPVHVAAYVKQLGHAMSAPSVKHRRDADVDIETAIGCHTLRATGITDCLTNGGKLEIAQHMAGHSSAKTTGLYDRRSDDISASEVERVGI